MFKKSIISILLFLPVLVFAGTPYIHHNLTVTLEPQQQSFQATDSITIPAPRIQPEITFLLNNNLQVSSLSPGVVIRLEKSNLTAKDLGMDREDVQLSSRISVNRYIVTLKSQPGEDAVFAVKFGGKIHYPIQQMGEEYARAFSQTPGIISDDGVFLSGSTYWVPWFDDELINFTLTTSLPGEWDVVSQGKRTLHKLRDGKRITRWDSPEPMEEIYLISARFTEYSRSAGAVNVMAFLRTPDENLANKYLETTAQYLEMYRKLIGPYPFSKFTLVENFWETGYGMPSFTLLGEKIIRFPFILHSSYPHELLHNYWGNSVYVDFSSGNWCEGLTAYMADHLIKEQRGQGADYRRSTLQKYTDYVNPSNDFPLKEFISRHDAPSEAVGYGKCLMMWDMLRGDVGDEQFVKGFQNFYRNYKFKVASFDDIRKSFESVTDSDFQPFFRQWVERTGAPELSLADVGVDKTAGGYKLSFKLNQVQKEAPFTLSIPVAVSFEDKVEINRVEMNSREQSYEMIFPEEPLLVQVDPQFNVFRSLHYNEIPPSLSKIFGSDEILILLPSRAPAGELETYRKLADKWAKDSSKKIEVRLDSEIKNIPADKAVWVFGTENIFRETIEKALSDYDAELGDGTVRFGKSSFTTVNNSFIVSVRHPQNPNSVLVLLTIGNPAAVDGLARKLPHYGKYSYLVFEGEEPANVGKGQWPAVNSPLTATIPLPGGKKPERINTELPLREPLARLAPVFSAERMMEYINYLSSDELEGRGPGSAGIEKAAEFIAQKFKEAGLQPGADDGSYYQVWEDVVDEKGTRKQVKNVIGVIPGANEKMAGESVVVCAHYDHLGYGWPDAYKGNKGKIHPGADDNASGVAVMLELANLMGKNLKPPRTIVFVAFTMEEAGLLGSRYYVKHYQRYPAKKIIGVLNLDTVGRLGKNKLMVLNTSSAREWKYIFMGAGYVTGVEAEMVTQDLDASDQVSFIEAGFPAVQFFSGPHSDYHRPTDTADKIDPAGLVKVATFVREGILYLAEREEPLTFMGTAATTATTKSPPKKGARRVSTGSMPDFAFSGEGVRLAQVSPDSPAEKAGLQAGDVIIQLGEYKITNLREYSDALKSYQPGDKVTLVFLRGEKKQQTTIELAER